MSIRGLEILFFFREICERTKWMRPCCFFGNIAKVLEQIFFKTCQHVLPVPKICNRVYLGALLERIFDNVVLILCSDRVTHAFQSESTLYSCQNVKDLLARDSRGI